MTIPHTELQSLTPTALITMFELDGTSIGLATKYRFYDGANGLGNNLVWQGVTYQAMAIQAEGFELSSNGTLPRPTLRVAALDGLVGGLIRDYEDLLRAKITRKRTFARFLDAVNFSGGVNPYGTPDPTKGLTDDVFFIERKKAETSDYIEFELVSALDLEGIRFPRRRIQTTICQHLTTDLCPYVASCDKTLDGANGCKFHYPTPEGTVTTSGNALPFGGFPAARLIGGR